MLLIFLNEYSKWDEYYRKYSLKELGWELGKPRPILVEYNEKGFLPKGKALDLCCGAGTNTSYLAENGFDATGMDISKTALKIAKKKTQGNKKSINFLAGSFVDLPFREDTFDLVFDMGCFHHVEVKERAKMIEGLYRILCSDGVYMLTCFSYRNGRGWNHFTIQQIVNLFSELFVLGKIRHYSSLEGDGVIRFFFTVLMKKKT
jgi:ubiquinone/menaquinone biosynthesis C-methylase UbiE